MIDGRRYVTRAEFGETWPFTTESATIGCGGLAGSLNGSRLMWYVFVEVKGTKYALNGLAQTRAKGLGWKKDIDSIWRSDPQFGLKGVKVNVGPMIGLALATCENDPWYRGGTLHNESGLRWQEASAANKLATAADLVSVAKSHDLLTPRIAGAIDDVSDIKPFATELVLGLDKAFAKDRNPRRNERMFANRKVSETAALLMEIMGWLK